MGILQTVRRRRVAVAGIVALGIVAGTGTALVVRAGDSGSDKSVAATPSTPTADPVVVAEQRRLTGIDSVLRTRADAVMSGRLDRFLATVDPRNQALRRRHTLQFANLRRLGLRSLVYQRQVPFVPMPQNRGFGVRVAMLVQLKDVDPSPRLTAVGYTFAERAGAWTIVADTIDVYAPEVTEPWDLGPIEVVRRPGIAVVVTAGERRNGTRLAAETAAALRETRSILGRAPASMLVVAVKDLRAMAGAATGGHPAGAVAIPNLVPVDPADLTKLKPAGSRVVLNPSERKDIDRSVLAHEFTHAAMAPLGGNAPTWLVEGLARYVERRTDERRGYSEWVSRQRQTVVRRWVPRLTTLPIDGVFHGVYGENSYGVSWIITEYLVSARGLPAVLTAYGEMARGRDDPDERERLLRKHLRMGESAIVAAVHRYRGPS